MRCGRIFFKTIKDVSEARGPNFATKLENILRWAKWVVIICLGSLVDFFDKKDLSNCPEIMNNEKNWLDK